MSIGRLCITILAVSQLFGCGTSQPIPASEARMVSPERLYLASSNDPSAAVAVFIRDINGGIYDRLLTVNGNRAALFEAGEKAVIRLSPGDYVFGVKPTNPFVEISEYTLDQKLEAGKTYTYRIIFDMGNGSTRLQRSVDKSINP